MTDIEQHLLFITLSTQVLHYQ